MAHFSRPRLQARSWVPMMKPELSDDELADPVAVRSNGHGHDVDGMRMKKAIRERERQMIFNREQEIARDDE
jgi:hypothetical protein